MKRIFFLITLFLIFLLNIFCLPVNAEGESLKVMSLNYDDSSAMVYISTVKTGDAELSVNKYVKLSNPNRIYFDINNAILVGGKQNLLFDRSVIKEIKLAQFETNPNIVRAVITFEEDFDTSKIELNALSNGIFVKILPLNINSEYFDYVYTESPKPHNYTDISVSSKAVQKVPYPADGASNSNTVINDIKKAFEDSTLPNTTEKTYDSVVSVDISSVLKLRNKYYVNQFNSKLGGVLVSGAGRLTTAKPFYLASPNRVVIDLPNTYIDKNLRNKEITICPDGACKDTARIGQFDRTTARIVINSEKPDKYINVYSQDSQSLLIIPSEKLNHTTLTNSVSNINKAYVKKIDSKTQELILSFTSPVVYSIVRSDNVLSLYLFNVQSYNEMDIIKTFNNTMYKPFTFSLLPKIGVRAVMPGLSKEDIINIEQGIDAKALKITISKSKIEEVKANPDRPFRRKTKDKIVIDPGHGGSDYGAIREGINEKDITLDVAQRVEAILRSKGYKTAMTRTDDTFVSLEDRVEFSEKEEPEIFVSIHVNSAVSTDPNGIETHWYHDYSKSLAETIHKHLIKEVPYTKDRGLFKSKFYVINHTTDPAVLCEIGFLSNADERNDLLTDIRKQKTAKAIADGIIEYLKSVNKNRGENKN